MHTGWKSRGGGIFPKFLEEVHALILACVYYSVFVAFSLTSIFENYPWGAYIISPLTPSCVHLWNGTTEGNEIVKENLRKRSRQKDDKNGDNKGDVLAAEDISIDEFDSDQSSGRISFVRGDICDGNYLQ